MEYLKMAWTNPFFRPLLVRFLVVLAFLLSVGFVLGFVVGSLVF